MEPDHLKGASGDAINVILAAALSAEGYRSHHLQPRDPGRIAHIRNTRPRAVPGFQTPGEVFMAELAKPGDAHPG